MPPPLIGSRISLISKKEIKYEGILYDINKKDATIVLKDVRSLGTEDREVEARVAATPTIYDFIKFKGSDIKDLHVHEDNTATPPPPAPTQSTPPATTSQPTPPPSKSTAPPVPAWSRGPPPGTITQPPPAAVTKPHSDAPPQQPAAQQQAPPQPRPRAAVAMPGTGAALVNRRVRGGNGLPNEIFTEEFDFQSANLAFDKEAEKASVVQGAAQVPVVVPKYNPSGFFDELSCDALDARSAFSMTAEKKKNSETFGAEGLQSNRRRPQNSSYRGGRGRGGRGNYGGRGQPSQAPPPTQQQARYPSHTHHNNYSTRSTNNYNRDNTNRRQPQSGAGANGAGGRGYYRRNNNRRPEYEPRNSSTAAR